MYWYWQKPKDQEVFFETEIAENQLMIASFKTKEDKLHPVHTAF